MLNLLSILVGTKQLHCEAMSLSCFLHCKDSICDNSPLAFKVSSLFRRWWFDMTVYPLLRSTRNTAIGYQLLSLTSPCRAGGRSACPAHTDIPRTHRTGTSNADGKSDRYCNPHSRHSRRFRSGQSRAFPA